MSKQNYKKRSAFLINQSMIYVMKNKTANKHTDVSLQPSEELALDVIPVSSPPIESRDEPIDRSASSGIDSSQTSSSSYSPRFFHSDTANSVSRASEHTQTSDDVRPYGKV